MKTILFLFLLGIGSTEQAKGEGVISGFVSGTGREDVTITAYQLNCAGDENKVAIDKTCGCGHYCFYGLTTSKMFKLTAEKDNCTFYPEFIQIFLPKWE